MSIRLIKQEQILSHLNQQVAGLSTTIPAFLRPIIARNKPIPAPIPNFKILVLRLSSMLLKGINY